MPTHSDFVSLSIPDNDLLASGLVSRGFTYMPKILSSVNIEDLSLCMGGCGSADDNPLRVICEFASSGGIAANNLHTIPISMSYIRLELPLLFLANG